MSENSAKLVSASLQRIVLFLRRVNLNSFHEYFANKPPLRSVVRRASGTPQFALFTCYCPGDQATG
jgi:hypothetical protein